MKYRTIVADPPWHVAAGPGWASGGATRPLVYPTMSITEIADLPVGDLAADEAHVYVWTINAYIPETYSIVRGWGFKPTTLLTWCKAPNGLGLGGMFSQTTEHILFGWRGRANVQRRHDSTWFRYPRGRHSAKPEAFLDLVETLSPAPRIELFARRNRLGWDTWGNEALEHVDLSEAARG